MDLDNEEPMVNPTVVSPPPYTLRDYSDQRRGSHRNSQRNSHPYAQQNGGATIPLDEAPPPYAARDTVVVPNGLDAGRFLTGSYDRSPNSTTDSIPSSGGLELASFNSGPRQASNHVERPTSRSLRHTPSHSSLPSRSNRHRQPHHEQQTSMPLQTLPCPPQNHHRGSMGRPSKVPNTNPYLQRRTAPDGAYRPVIEMGRYRTTEPSSSGSSRASSRTQSPFQRQHAPNHVPIHAPIHAQYPSTRISPMPFQQMPAATNTTTSPTRIRTTPHSRSPVLVLPPQGQLDYDHRTIYPSSADNSQEPIYADPGDLSHDSGHSYPGEEHIYATVDENQPFPSYLHSSNV